jgi:hypothetical protein
MSSYYELWTILGNWKSEFSSKDFASAFSSPDPRKVLSDMSNKGFLKRIGRGRYKVVDSASYARSRNNIDEAYDFLRRARLPYALTGADGVFVWTRGGYNANRFSGSYPIYTRIPKAEISNWERFLRETGKKYTIEGKPAETMYGIYYVLLPEDAIESRSVDGLSVEPLERTVEFCLREPYTYEPALEMLDKKYNLGLGANYETAGFTA